MYLSKNVPISVKIAPKSVFYWNNFCFMLIVPQTKCLEMFQNLKYLTNADYLWNTKYSYHFENFDTRMISFLISEHAHKITN